MSKPIWGNVADVSKVGPLPPSPFGRLVRKTIRDLGVTQDAFAQMVGVARPTIHVWLTASRPNPKPAQRQRVAEVIGVDRSLIDEAVYIGLGFSLAPVPEQVQLLARLAMRLDEYDLADFEGQMLAALAKYRRGRTRPGQ